MVVKLKIGSIVAITWEDAVVQDSDNPEADDLSPPIATTYGKLVKETEGWVAVAAEVFEDGVARGITTIPRAIIRKMEFLR